MKKLLASIITISNRYGGIDITYSCLKKQVFQDWEWIFLDTLYDERKDAVKAFTKNDSRVKHYKQFPKNPRAKTWLAHAENEAIRQSSGELLVFLQDFIYIQPDALEKFCTQYKTNSRYFVTGVGNQYVVPGKDMIVDYKGLITLFAKPYTRQPEVVMWQDPRMRKDLGSFYPCRPEDWEMNFAYCPRKMMYDIGGCDESYDYQGFAFDNCSVAIRAFLLGYEPYIDQSNESFSINSDAWSKSPAKTDEDFSRIALYHLNRMKDIRDKKSPIKLPYLF